MIRNKLIQRAAKEMFRSCLVDSVFDETRARQSVQQLVASRHRDSQPILQHFYRLLKLDRAQHTAIVESAEPLGEELQAATLANLTRLYGKGLTMTFSQRPSLIGGMRIQVGSDVYDGSVQAGLAALEKRF